MIPIILKSGKTRIKADVPTGWHELTFGQVVDLSNKKDPVSVAVILLNLDRDIVNRIVTKSMYQVSAIISGWMTEQMPTPGSPPKEFRLLGKVVKVPKIEEVKYQQAVLARQLIEDADTEDKVMKSLPALVAILVYDSWAGSFDEAKAKKLESDIRGLPSFLGLSLGSFFLSELIVSGKSGVKV